MINVQVSEQFATQVNQEQIESAVATALKLQYREEPDITIVIDSDEGITELNRQFRGIDAPTDVLSFEAGDSDPETGILYLGDIIISYERAVAQAHLAGHPVQNELTLLAVHGTLHLLGFDHSNDEEKQQMWDVQQEILDANHIAILKLPEE
jgi:probable rRNA maturation factor